MIAKNFEVQRYGEPVVPDYDIRITQILWKPLTALDLDARAELLATASIT
jgi:hypothetical protein